MTPTYLVLSVLFILFMFTIWSKVGLLNVTIKFLTLLLGVFGIYVIIATKVFG